MKNRIDITALLLVIAGAVNWGLIGIFRLDSIPWLFDGPTGAISRSINVVIALAGLWCIKLAVIQMRRSIVAAPDSAICAKEEK